MVLTRLPLTLIIVESALELVPRELWREPSIIATAKRRGKKPSEILLDMSLHYHAMKRYLRDWYKRGRPDIIHFILINALSSPLNYERLLNIYIHTIHGEIIGIDPSTRIPRNYNRFVGLMEQLLTRGKVPIDADKPLLQTLGMNIRELLRKEDFKEIILLDEKGKYMKLQELAKIVSSKKTAILIGGFQRGDFSSDTLSLATKTISIYPKALDAWIVVSRVIEAIERVYKIME